MKLIDNRKIKKGSKITVRRIEDNNILTFEFYYVGYKHTNFQLIEQGKYTPVLGCGYYSRKDKLNDWFNNNGKFIILNVEY